MHPSSLHTFCSKRITCTLGITLLCWIPWPWFIIISSDQQVCWWHLLNGVCFWLCGIEVLMVVVPRRRFVPLLKSWHTCVPTKAQDCLVGLRCQKCRWNGTWLVWWFFFPLPFVGTWEVKEQQFCVVSARKKGECLCTYREERDGQKIQPCCSSDSVTAEAGARVA
jgi:hypothetical protein